MKQFSCEPQSVKAGICTACLSLPQLAAMDGSSCPPLDAVELRAISETLTVKEIKKLLKDLQVDVSSCIEKSELLTALVDRLENDQKKEDFSFFLLQDLLQLAFG